MIKQNRTQNKNGHSNAIECSISEVLTEHAWHACTQLKLTGITKLCILKHVNSKYKFFCQSNVFYYL